jgi:pyruvate dehydrogenase E1 component alpha subunit
MGHSMSDPAHGHYRTKEEVEAQRMRDPLTLLQQTILSNKLGVAADFTQLEREVGDVVATAVKFADDSSFPNLSTLHSDVVREA